MKINVLFVAAALAYGSSLVVAQNLESSDSVGIVAREPDVDVDVRELNEDLEAREPELTIDIDAREFDDDDLEAREEDEDIFARVCLSMTVIIIFFGDLHHLSPLATCCLSPCCRPRPRSCRYPCSCRRFQAKLTRQSQLSRSCSLQC